jgi:hypothetical protein
MNRFLITFIFIVSINASFTFNPAVIRAEEPESKKQALTQEQAAELASKLANEKFQKAYRRSPFTPESYTAELTGSRWHWGKIDPVGINGCSAVVEFNEDGTDEKVKVALHTDTLIEDKAPITIKIIPDKGEQKENPLPENIQK